MITVTLTGPAKVGGLRKRPGDVVEVDPTTLRQLVAAGAVAPDLDATAPLLTGAPVRTLTQAEFETAVAGAAKVLAETMLDAVLAEALAPLETEKNAALARAIEAEAQRDMLQSRVLELQAQLAAATEKAPAGETPPDTDTPQPSEKAAKTAPRKGAAATKG